MYSSRGRGYRWADPAATIGERINSELAGADEGVPVEVAPGLWGWAARHPEWHPGEWGASVWSWALRAGDDALLVDPLLPADPERVDALIERLCEARRLAILITIPYHVRSAAAIRDRRGDAVDVSIHGHESVARRLPTRRGFRAIEPGAELPGGALGFEIGRPKRNEHPLHLPSHDALAFGDAVVGTPAGLRMWAQRRPDAAHVRFYRERFAPTLEPLVELGAANVLVGHGPSAVGDGEEQLRLAIRAKPWYHRG